jgi:hypothetical protein
MPGSLLLGINWQLATLWHAFSEAAAAAAAGRAVNMGLAHWLTMYHIDTPACEVTLEAFHSVVTVTTESHPSTPLTTNTNALR